MLEKRCHRGFLGKFLGFWYYWLDLYGPQEHPANSKVLSAFGFFVALLAEVWWGWNLSKPGAAGITWPFVALVAITLSLAFGKDVFKAALKLKNGGSNGDHRLSSGESVHRSDGSPWPQGSPDDPGNVEAG